MKESSCCPYFPRFRLRPLKTSTGLLTPLRTTWSLGLGVTRTCIQFPAPPRTSCVIWYTLFPPPSLSFLSAKWEQCLPHRGSGRTKWPSVCRARAHGKRSAKLCFPASGTSLFRLQTLRCRGSCRGRESHLRALVLAAASPWSAPRTKTTRVASSVPAHRGSFLQFLSSWQNLSHPYNLASMPPSFPGSANIH